MHTYIVMHTHLGVNVSLYACTRVCVYMCMYVYTCTTTSTTTIHTTATTTTTTATTTTYFSVVLCKLRYTYVFLNLL